MAEAGMTLADRLNQVTDVERPVPIVPVELVPIDREVDLALPLPEERGLSVARIGGDDDRPAIGVFAEPFEQARSPKRWGHVVRRRDLVVDQRVYVLDVRH